MLRGFWLVVVLVLVGCGGTEGEQGAALDTKRPEPMVEAGAAGTPSVEPPVVICEAGRQVECPCPNGGKGAQACASDGSKWSVCQCDDVKPPEPTKSPAEKCGPPDNEKLEPEAACPIEKPTNYWNFDHCLDAYVESGICAWNLGRLVVCCQT
jgi:hypothetical protein